MTQSELSVLPSSFEPQKIHTNLRTAPKLFGMGEQRGLQLVGGVSGFHRSQSSANRSPVRGSYTILGQERLQAEVVQAKCSKEGAMHRFGGAWTETKLLALQQYLERYTTALKNKGFTLHYVDAFAGSGSFVPTSGDAQERKGSARLALSVAGFRHFHFIEKGARRCERLRELASDYTDVEINVLEGDANKHLIELCRITNWKSARAVLFLDPYGMQVEWATLEQVAKTGSIDVWYLFPLSGVTRQLTRNASKIDGDKQRSLDRVLGTDTWRESFYDLDPPPDLFGNTEIERHADSSAIEAWITKRLGEIFPVVVGPVILRKGSKGRADSGPPLFALYFLASTQSIKGQEVARRIANGVLNKLKKEGFR